MLVHGYNLSDLLLSTIIFIPKDLKGSLSKSDNYRGISLVNSICKLSDYVIIILYDKQTVIWVDSVNHLGNIINNDLKDIDDCKMKCSSFISSFNKLHFSYANVQRCILSKLFVLLTTVQVYGVFLQKVLEKLLHCGI